MELYNIGDRIEGAHCELYSRKEVSPGCLQEHPITGKPCIRVELSRNATAEISKEMIFTEEELACRQGVNITEGDKLKGDAITVYVCQRRPVRFYVREGATHTHGGNFASTKNQTLCEIKYPHDHIKNGIQKRQISIQKLIK